MDRDKEAAIQSGAREVEEREHLEAGLEVPGDVAAKELQPEEPESEPIETELGELTFSMFQQGSGIRVRVGSALNSSELYEAVFQDADTANTAMLDAGILTREQVPDTQRLAGTGLTVRGLTVQQLEEAGLKRHGSSTL